MSETVIILAAVINVLASFITIGSAVHYYKGQKKKDKRSAKRMP